MACNFTTAFTGTAANFVAGLKAKILENNGTFEGNDNAGTFSVPVPTSHIEGDYYISGQDMAIEITHKPFFLSCGQIQNYVETNLGGGAG